MAQREEHKAGYPLAPANGHARSDEESQTAEELRLKKRKKIIFFAIFMGSQIVMGILFTLIVMKFRNPKFRMRSATFETFSVPSSSFNMTMNAQFGVKNPNYGPYKYSNTTVDFFYKETPVGTGIVYKSKATLLSTKKLNIAVNLVTPSNLVNNTQLVKDISSRLLPLNSRSNMTGKITLMFVMKKRKHIQMNCTMNVNITSRELQDINCN